MASAGEQVMLASGIEEIDAWQDDDVFPWPGEARHIPAN